MVISVILSSRLATQLLYEAWRHLTLSRPSTLFHPMIRRYAPTNPCSKPQNQPSSNHQSLHRFPEPNN